MRIPTRHAGFVFLASVFSVLSLFAQEEQGKTTSPTPAKAVPANDVPTRTGMVGTVSDDPQITGIPGGYSIRFPTLTPVGGLMVRGPLSGDYELQFNTTVEKSLEPSQPVTDIPVLVPLADYWIVRGKPERAIPLYERGLKTDPTNLLLQNNLALLLSSIQENHERAIEVIDAALKERPDHVTLLDTKSLILLNAGHADQAIPLLQKAVELSCQGPVYVLHLAYALDMAGDDARARDWFERVRPQIEGAPNKMLKDNQDMFDALRNKFGTGF